MAKCNSVGIAQSVRAATSWRWIRLSASFAGMTALAACSSGPHISSTQEAAQYASHARGNYTPPGPPSDPWGPYIKEAAATYDVPERWVREVIRQESSGQVMSTSAPGAMGLMQIMPATYDELRARYALGDDAYNPHDNIMAGTAYIRELYDIYGAPGFLAAYNAGPGRFDDYLSRRKSLPDETRNYVARIAPRLGSDQPNRLSPASQYAMNQIPNNIPPGPRPSRMPQPAPVALATADTRRSGLARGRVDSSPLTAPAAPAPQAVALANPPASTPHSDGFRLIPQAMADTLPRQTQGQAGAGTGGWAIQVGAYGNPALAHAAAETALNKVQTLGAKTAIGTTHQATGTLYRARIVGLTHEAALQACQKIGKCIVLSPDAQG